MKINVQLCTTLKSLMPAKLSWMTIELDDNGTVDDLIQKLPAELNIKVIIQVNDKRQFRKTLLKDGDRVKIFPPLGGG